MARTGDRRLAPTLDDLAAERIGLDEFVRRTTALGWTRPEAYDYLAREAAMWPRPLANVGAVAANEKRSPGGK